jgi:hypothetical protein
MAGMANHAITPALIIRFIPFSFAVFSTLEIHFLFFKNEFREGTYTPLWGVSAINHDVQLITMK